MPFPLARSRHLPNPRWRAVLAGTLVVVALAATSVVAVTTARSYTPSPLQRSDAEVTADALPARPPP